MSRKAMMRNDWKYETCKCCTREQRLAWWITNELWNRVVIDYYRNTVLCLECFLRMSDDAHTPISMDDINITGLVCRDD